MKRLVLSLIATIAVAMGIQAQHCIIKKTNGDSIQWTISSAYPFFKIGNDGKPVWVLSHEYNKFNHESESSDIEYIRIPSYEEDYESARKALIEFYNAMDGPHWKHNENWCTDKPIWEWYGVNGCDNISIGDQEPYVSSLTIENASGSIPDCILNMGNVGIIRIDGNLTGEIPECLGNLYNLTMIEFGDSKGIGGLTGNIPKWIWPLRFNLQNNKFSGSLPADLLVYEMEHAYSDDYFNINYNDYSGKIPEAVLNHPKLSEYWLSFVYQNGKMDLTDLWGILSAPNTTFPDIDGKNINLGEVYNAHKYTLLYQGRYGHQWTDQLNRTLIPVYNAYKKNDPSNLEIVEMNLGSGDWLLPTDDELAENVAQNNIPWINVRSDVWSDYEFYRQDHKMGMLTNRTDDYYTPKMFLVDQQGKVVWTSIIDNTGRKQNSFEYVSNIFSVIEDKLGKIDYETYTSTDFTEDGKWITLQEATRGNGVDIVFMGDGFVDIDMGAGGVYETRMRDAMEQFFAVEPFTSLRDCFNVYMVKAVSLKEGNFDDDTHAIDYSDEKAFEYAQKVTKLIPDRPMRVVVINKSAYQNTRSMTSVFYDASFVAYMKDGGTDKSLNHEAGGHGVGRLLDEYVEYGYEDETLPDDLKSIHDMEWSKFGRGANIDYHADPTEVKWAKFINDARYDTEGIGVFEGSWLYGHGAYRPTDNSMMRHGNIPFNAPSREAIYKYVMQESEGEGWTYDYETFVAFDAAGHTEFVNALNNASRRAQQKDAQSMSELTAPPVLKKGTWRDALKK